VAELRNYEIRKIKILKLTCNICPSLVDIIFSSILFNALYERIQLQLSTRIQSNYLIRSERKELCRIVWTKDVNVGRRERSREWAIYDFLSTRLRQQPASSPSSRTSLRFPERRTTSKISWAVVSNASWWTMCQGVHTINRRVVVVFARSV